MKYDDACWHYKADFPRGMPKEYGGTHIGLLLRWCFTKGWVGKKHTNRTLVDQVISGYLSGTTFLFEQCHGQLCDLDLSDKGNQFVKSYYHDDAYMDDYCELFGELLFSAPEEEHDFDLFSNLMESHLADMEFSEEVVPDAIEVVEVMPVQVLPKKKPWWKFW